VKRRTFIAGLGSAAAWPVVARAQQSGQVRRVGVVMSGAESDPEQAKQESAFREGMRKLGFASERPRTSQHRHRRCRPASGAGPSRGTARAD
jgi:putative ABC transport system substrate-binding protein